MIVIVLSIFLELGVECANHAFYFLFCFYIDNMFSFQVSSMACASPLRVFNSNYVILLFGSWSGGKRMNIWNIQNYIRAWISRIYIYILWIIHI